MLFSPLIERALRLAGRKHHPQVRKVSDVPYFTHLAGAAIVLLRAGMHDEQIIAAALLHDVVEDTDCELEDLEGEFPPDVVAWVAVSTEQKHNTDGTKRSWEDRKQEHVSHIAAAPREARAIVLADKLHNLGSMLYDHGNDPSFWDRFGAPPERLVWYYTEMVNRAASDDPELATLAGECRTLLAQLQHRFA
ncbi:MAG: bifunctional (p)ppGpp synthetase/guanosine-3',5'-bis(diphosphate) 3'-pyrophosphohydrolase [Planctomycetaceae bacterium]|nr:bifunctional (p)ppGpp synthetase/guanosine-3',5'-bis(diphosphate) 3'-pyrophosphohydrolase [Planctomycetaceae bacterium]